MMTSDAKPHFPRYENTNLDDAGRLDSADEPAVDHEGDAPPEDDTDGDEEGKSSATRPRPTAGCDCGQCIEGYLSPAMQTRLHYAADYNADMQSIDIPSIKSGTRHALEGSLLEYHFPAPVRDRSTKSFLYGVVAILRAISYCLSKQIAPSPAKLARTIASGAADITTLEARGYNNSFQSQGGTITNVLGFLLDLAKAQSPLGDNTFSKILPDPLAGIPTCSNDLEFDLVRSKLKIPEQHYMGYFDCDESSSEAAGEDDASDYEAWMQARIAYGHSPFDSPPIIQGTVTGPSFYHRPFVRDPSTPVTAAVGSSGNSAGTRKRTLAERETSDALSGFDQTDAKHARRH